jgi:general secretion pathway protein G
MFDRLLERQREFLEARGHGEEAGFTLIELLIVIVVLGILAAVVIFGLSGLTGQSAQSACNGDAKTVEIAVEAYHAQQGQWPANSTITGSGSGIVASDPPLTNTVNGIRYLRTFPTNSSHYVIWVESNGEVDVTPFNGQGAIPATVTAAATNTNGTGPSSWNYDGTAALGGGTTSPNPCSYVS